MQSHCLSEKILLQVFKFQLGFKSTGENPALMNKHASWLPIHVYSKYASAPFQVFKHPGGRPAGRLRELTTSQLVCTLQSANTRCISSYGFNRPIVLLLILKVVCAMSMCHHSWKGRDDTEVISIQFYLHKNNVTFWDIIWLDMTSTCAIMQTHGSFWNSAGL